MQYIALIEFIGYADFILNNDTDQRLKHYSAFVTAIDELFAANDAEEEIHHWKEKIILVNQGGHFLIFSEDDSPRSFGDVMLAVRSILPMALFAGFPPKAVISYGEVLEIERKEKSASIIEPMLFLGQEPARMKNILTATNWVGCHISDVALDAFHASRSRQTVSLGELVAMQILLEYPVPGIESLAYVVNWVSVLPDTMPYGMLRYCFVKCLSEDKADELESLISNTHAFIKSVQSPRVN